MCITPGLLGWLPGESKVSGLRWRFSFGGLRSLAISLPGRERDVLRVHHMIGVRIMLLYMVYSSLRGDCRDGISTTCLTE